MTKTFKYRLEQQTAYEHSGGQMREVSVADFRVSTAMSGVSLRLAPGTLRELHWHTNASEWGYVVSGSCRTTILHPDGTTYIDNFNSGDVWYFPKGYGHSIQGMGPDECHIIQIMNNGSFTEKHTFSITDFIAQTPIELVAQNLGISIEDAQRLPKKESYFAYGQVPDDSTLDATARSATGLTSMHRYPLMAQDPKRVPGGGTERVASARLFPISTNMTGAIIEIQPGALREMHWHPNTDEWQYYISGTARMAVFLGQGELIEDQFEAGDVGYVPEGAGHYIYNNGTEVCRILVGFNHGQHETIDLTKWISSTPNDVLATNLEINREQVSQLPQRHWFIAPAALQ